MQLNEKLIILIPAVLGLIFGLLEGAPTILNLLQKETVLTDKDVISAFEGLEMAQKHLENNDFHKAIEMATKVIEKLPKKAEAYRIRAKAHQSLFELSSALADYETAIELEPGYPFVHCERAALLQQMGEYKKALYDMKKCMAIAPDLPSAIFQAAHTYFLIGEFDEARKLFEKVIDHSNTSDREKRMSLDHISRIENVKLASSETEDEQILKRLSK